MTTDALTRLLVPGTDPDVADIYAALADRARNTAFGFENETVFVDIETTGVDPERDSIIEIAAVLARGPEILGRFHTMVDPGRPVPAEITKLTGIDVGMLKGAPGPEEAATQFAEFAGKRDIVAHNVAFDKGFLTRAAGKRCFSGSWIDSLQLAMIALPRLRSHRLHDLAYAFGGTKPTHRAADDAEALAFLWRVMLCAVDELPRALVSRLAQLAPATKWTLRPILAHMAAVGRTPAFDLKEVRKERAAIDWGESLSDATDGKCQHPRIDEIAEDLSPGGLVGRAYEAFEVRQEQISMAQAALKAFTTDSHVAIEAGTGVGKSLAYLVPAAHFARLNGIGVGVATKTNSLTDQLIYSELPALCRAFGGELRYASLKGYDRYLCLRKLERFAATLDEASDEAIVTVAALMTWVTQSSWGDLDATNVHVCHDARVRISASVAECTRKRCRFYPNLCYLHGARRRACCAHIVVTNHALLFRDVVTSGNILPPLRYWIIDEAHAVESEARKQLTLEASHIELASALEALHAPDRGGGVLDSVRRKLVKEGAAEHPALLTRLVRAEEQISKAATLTGSLFSFVKELSEVIDDSAYDTCEVRIDQTLRESTAWGTIVKIGTALIKTLAEVIESGRMLVTLLEEAGDTFNDVRADLAGFITRVADQVEGLGVVLSGEDDRYVYYVVLDRRRDVIAERLVAARLDVGEALADEFYPRTRSVVLTSATIATGEDFSHFIRAVGLDRYKGAGLQTHRLQSSYDFDRQMAVFVPNDLPPPGTSGYLSALERLLFDIHVAMGGSTLTLFTNRREMEAVYRALAPRLYAENIPLLVQSRSVSPKRLRDEFLAEKRLSLFATKSFWEGFDAKGDTLRCVVVTKLPFGRPNDPLASERQAREGCMAWRRYALPGAIIELKQAAGRLIRSSTDTGCLVITDVRLLQKDYGREFLKALPVRNIEVLSAQRLTREISDRFTHC